jgi:hypothetical protein
LGEAKFSKDGANVFCNLGRRDSCKTFGSSGASRGDCLGLGAIGNSFSSKHESVASGGTPLSEIIAMGSINVTDKVHMLFGRGKLVERGQNKSLQWYMGKSGIWNRAQIDNTPVDGIAEVFGNVFETKVEELGGFDGKFGEDSNSIPDVGTGGDIGKQQFTKQQAVRKTHFQFKFGMFGSGFGSTDGVVDGLKWYEGNG